MDTASLRELKRRISPMLLGMSGVTGVGVSGNRIRIYLEYDSPAVRKRVAVAVRDLVSEDLLAFEVIGKLRAAVPHN